MNDRSVSLLDQYELEVERTRKGRGAILCETDRGLLIFKEYSGNPEHLRMQDGLLRMIEQRGLVQAEQLVPTKEGALYVKGSDGICYILKTYREARECNIREREECISAVKELARLHLCTENGLDEEFLTPPAIDDPDENEIAVSFSAEKEMSAEYEKRNRELKKIRKFLLCRSQKTWFEISLLRCFEPFYEQARQAQESWDSYRKARGEDKQKAVCHGDYQYHNLLFDQRGWYHINFEHCVIDDPVRDLHLLMRKLLEKSDWSVSLGEDLLYSYERIRPLSAFSRIDLYYRLLYPEKFWKIANFYYNSGKAWIPGRNMEKLERLMDQEEAKRDCLEKLFRV